MINSLSIDWEDWYQVPLARIPIDQWKDCVPCVEKPTYELLTFLQKKNLRATFFVSGFCADRHPVVLKDIAAAGHEIESHGYWHELAHQQSEARFEEDVRRSVEVIHGVCGQRPIGYRAPAWSTTKVPERAVTVLCKYGFLYDSSFIDLTSSRQMTIQHSDCYFINDSALLEIPPPTIGLGKFRIPVTGGFFMRAAPLPIFKHLLRRQNKIGSGMIYFHPWELCMTYPKMPISALSSFVQYYKCGGVFEILEELTSEFEFGSFKQTYPELSKLALLKGGDTNLITGASLN